MSWIDDEADLESYGGQEREANDLAGRVLVPDAALRLVRDQQKPAGVAQYDEWLAPLRDALGVSGEVILCRLLNSGRLAQGDYTAYRDWKRLTVWERKPGGNRKNRYLEPIRIFGDGFVRTVVQALMADEITLVKASAYLDDLKIRDVRQLEQYCYANA